MIWALMLGDRNALICATTKSRMRSTAFALSFSRSGLMSSMALVDSDSFLFMAAYLLAISSRAWIQLSSKGPSDMVLTVTGDTLISSTAGPSNASTFLLFSSLAVSCVDRVWRLSISADTAPSSV
jgi:hypothetical protein